MKPIRVTFLSGKNADHEVLQDVNRKRRLSIIENIEYKKKNGLLTPIEVSTMKLKEETGLSNFMQMPKNAKKVREKQKKTLQERYGVSNISQIPGWREKIGSSISETKLSKPK
jgi:hypothetical protein